MPKLLRIDASSRDSGSHSRDLADYFINHWMGIHPTSEIITRDLISEPLPHISDTTIKGFYSAKSDHDETLKSATALSDFLIHELMQAETLLISTPMYNFSVPSALKAWIDQIVRTGETFSYAVNAGFTGLVPCKRAFIITATGASYSDVAMQSFDFLTPYLKTLLSFLGINELTFFHLEGTTTDETALKNSRQTAQARINQLGAQS